MPQPAENTEAADRLITEYRAAQESLTAQLASIDPQRDVARRRLRELLRAVDTEIDRLEAATHRWVTVEIPAVYGRGADQAAVTVGSEFTWTQPHIEAVQAFAESTQERLLEATQYVRDATKQTIRGIARNQTRRALLEGVTATQAGADMAAQVIAATGALTVQYANGAEHPIAAHAETVIRTETAKAYNAGTFTQARGDGFDQMEVFDGPDCGWTSHDDDDLADGSIRTLAECEDNPISHPNCARSFAPAV